MTTFVEKFAVKFAEVPETKYYEMMEILPPIAWEGARFLVGEPNDHRECSITLVVRPTFHGYWEVDGKYYTAVFPVGDGSVTDCDLTVPEFRQVSQQHIRANIVKPENPAS